MDTGNKHISMVPCICPYKLLLVVSITPATCPLFGSIAKPSSTALSLSLPLLFSSLRRMDVGKVVVGDGIDIYSKMTIYTHPPHGELGWGKKSRPPCLILL